MDFHSVLSLQVSPEEWQNIPEVGDARNRKKRLAGVREKYTPISDRILSNSLGKAQESNHFVTSIRNVFKFSRHTERIIAVLHRNLVAEMKKQISVEE